MLITCDLGEGLDHIDSLIMPMIDMASIACGGHAGDQTSIEHCVSLALRHNVSIGAHPSYADKENFGRISLSIEPEKLHNDIEKQLERIQLACRSRSNNVNYVKPHGALYNDMMKDAQIFEAVLSALSAFKEKHQLHNCPLLIQALPNNTQHKRQAAKHNISLLFEAFADRAYADTGMLVSRTQYNATYKDVEAIVGHAKNLVDGFVVTESGNHLAIAADCLCIHSDNPIALNAIGKIREILSKNE